MSYWWLLAVIPPVLLLVYCLCRLVRDRLAEAYSDQDGDFF